MADLPMHVEVENRLYLTRARACVRIVMELVENPGATVIQEARDLVREAEEYVNR